MKHFPDYLRYSSRSSYNSKEQTSLHPSYIVRGQSTWDGNQQLRLLIYLPVTMRGSRCHQL